MLCYNSTRCNALCGLNDSGFNHFNRQCNMAVENSQCCNHVLFPPRAAVAAISVPNSFTSQVLHILRILTSYFCFSLVSHKTQRPCTSLVYIISLSVSLPSPLCLSLLFLGTAAEQFENLKNPCRQLAKLSAEYKLVCVFVWKPTTDACLCLCDRFVFSFLSLSPLSLSHTHFLSLTPLSLHLSPLHHKHTDHHAW